MSFVMLAILGSISEIGFRKLGFEGGTTFYYE